MKKSLILCFLAVLSLLTVAHNTTYAFNLNDVIYRDLNDLTLNEVFEENNLSSLAIGIINYTNDGNISFQNIERTQVPINMNDELYFIYDMKFTTNSINPASRVEIRLYNFTEDIVALNYSIDERIKKSGMSVSTTTGITDIRFRYLVDDYNDYIITLYDYRIINKTTLGIDNLTKEQMDYYYQLYLNHEAIGFDLMEQKEGKNIINTAELFGDNLLIFLQKIDTIIYKTYTVGFKVDFLGIDTSISFSFITLLGTSFIVGVMGAILIKKVIL